MCCLAKNLDTFGRHISFFYLIPVRAGHPEGLLLAEGSPATIKAYLQSRGFLPKTLNFSFHIDKASQQHVQKSLDAAFMSFPFREIPRAKEALRDDTRSGRSK